MCVCWRKMISSSIGPCEQLLDLLSYPNLWLSMGYRQIKSEPTMFVMLSYSWFFLEHTPLHLLVWPMLSPCSHSYGIPSPREAGWIVVEPIDNILVLSIILLNIKVVLETFESIFFILSHEGYVWTKEVSPSNSCALDASFHHEFEKACFTSSGIIPSQSCTCEVFLVW